MPTQEKIHRDRIANPHKALRGGHYCDVKEIIYHVAMLDAQQQTWVCPGCGVEIPGAEYAHRLRTGTPTWG